MRMPRPLLRIALLALLPVLAFAAEAKRTPNVILIVADDLGIGDVSAYGMGKVKTPNIDRLATEGIRFTDAYAPSSTCTPTRYSIMTGEYAWRKKGTGILPGDAPLIIGVERTTLPKIFRDAGYATAAIGKWHLGMGDGKPDFNRPVSPGINDTGFDYSFGMAATGDRVPCVYMENGRVVGLDPKDPIAVSYGKKIGAEPTGREHPELLRMKPNEGHADTIVNGISRIGFMSGGKAALWDDRTLSDTFNAKALEFVRANKAKPFFLYYAAHEPHVPRDPNPRFVGKSGLGARADAILQLDEQVGKILDTLRAEGIDRDTLVILSSDNGPAVADGYADGALVAETRGAHTPNGVYRGGKYTDFEGGLRMPFLARWPGVITPGTVSKNVVSLIDMPASAAALTGRKLLPEEAPDSFDLLPALRGETRSATPVRIFGNGSGTAIREGDLKLLTQAGPRNAAARNPAKNTPAPVDTPLLFDLANDPGETVNLAAQRPDDVKRLRAKLDAAVAAGFTREGAAPAPKR